MIQEIFKKCKKVTKVYVNINRLKKKPESEFVVRFVWIYEFIQKVIFELSKHSLTAFALTSLRIRKKPSSTTANTEHSDNKKEKKRKREKKWWNSYDWWNATYIHPFRIEDNMRLVWEHSIQYAHISLFGLLTSQLLLSLLLAKGYPKINEYNATFSAMHNKNTSISDAKSYMPNILYACPFLCVCVYYTLCNEYIKTSKSIRRKQKNSNLQ